MWDMDLGCPKDTLLEVNAERLGLLGYYLGHQQNAQVIRCPEVGALSF